MTTRLIALSSLLASALFSAEIKPTAIRMAPSGAYTRHTAANSPGVGIAGGIGQYQPGGTAAMAEFPVDLSAYGPTDNVMPAINAKIAEAVAAGGGRVKIPAGDWYSTGGLSLGRFTKNIIVSGEGMGVTRILHANTGSFVTLGTASQWNYPTADHASTSPLNQGDTSITLTTAPGAFAAGTLIRIEWTNMEDNTAIAAGAIPVFHTEGNARVRTHLARIISKASNTITFAPTIPFQPHASLTATAYSSYDTSYIPYNVGIENLSVIAQPGYSIFNVINFKDAYNCWLLNVDIETNGLANYAINLANVTRVEVRGCYIHGPGTEGSNRAGLLVSNSTALLIEDNIFNNVSPPIEVNFSTTGSVFAHNFSSAHFNINHGPGNFGNMYIRNIVSYFMSDGYFGPSESDIFIGNWAHTYGGLLLRRFTFNAHSYGNVWGATTDTAVNDWVNGQGIANIGGTDDLTQRSSFLTGDFPASWKHPTQYVRLNSKASSTVGNWEFLGNAYMRAALGFSRVSIETVGFTSYSGTIESGGKLFSTALSGGGTIPDEWVGESFPLVAAGTAGYQEHNDDVWETIDFRGNFLLSPNYTSFPAQTIGSDTIWEPLGDTSKPSGDGIDEINWGDSPWYDNGGVQYGFINRSNPSAVTVRDIPAGRRFTDGTIFTPPADSPPSFSTHPATQSVTVGDNVTLTVAGGGNPSPTLQWRKGGSNISGATSSSLVLTNVQLADAGSYDCVATNSEGTATSTAAVLTVNAAPSSGGTATVTTLNAGTLNISP